MKNIIARRLLIALAVITILTGGAYALRDGDVIKVYVTGRDARELIREFNSTMTPHSIRLEEVESAWQSDVRISLQEDALSGGSYGHAHPMRGYIAISSSVPSDKLLKVVTHELLHYAGERHETEPDSVMNTRSARWTLSDSQVRSLRRLSGITFPERVIAEIRSEFDNNYSPRERNISERQEVGEVEALRQKVTMILVVLLVGLAIAFLLTIPLRRSAKELEWIGQQQARILEDDIRRSRR